MKTISLEKKRIENEEHERCVLCGKLTSIPKDLHVDFRANYIEGCGQLCSECAKK